jgi:hypothetical protein
MSNETMRPDFDPRIADWLEADPDHAPRETLETVLAALPSIPQRRASRVPWRFATMNRFMPIGAAAVIAIVLVGGALIMLRPNGNGVGTTPTASPTVSPSSSASPATPTSSPDLAACSLVTADEAESLAGIMGLGALPTASGAGNETTCIYRDGGGNIVLRVEFTRSGGGLLFEEAQNAPGVEAVADLGDGAVFDPETSTLSFMKGDSLVTIVTGTSSKTPASRLATERAIAELAVERVTPTP